MFCVLFLCFVFVFSGYVDELMLELQAHQRRLTSYRRASENVAVNIIVSPPPVTHTLQNKVPKAQAVQTKKTRFPVSNK